MTAHDFWLARSHRFDHLKAKKRAEEEEGEMTREELAAMTDGEILAHYRVKHGDPDMPLSMAKKMHHETFKWWHSTALAKKRAEEERQEAERRIREVLREHQSGVGCLGQGDTQ
jgi:hypothetical protein